MASFFMMLAKRGILKHETMIDIIVHFQTVLTNKIDIENNSYECEEISEILFILISMGNNTFEKTISWTLIIKNAVQITRKIIFY